MKKLFTILLLTLSSFSFATDIGCTLGTTEEAVYIKFSGVVGKITPKDLKNYGDKGKISVTAELTTKSGKIKKFYSSVDYKKVGERLEFPYVNLSKIYLDTMTKKEFKEIFGPLPDLKCYAS